MSDSDYEDYEEEEGEGEIYEEEDDNQEHVEYSDDEDQNIYDDDDDDDIQQRIQDEKRASYGKWSMGKQKAKLLW